MNIIADVAGRYDELMLLLNQMPKSDLTIYVGDLNDRGPKSKQVIEYVMSEPNSICLNSNHGDMFVDFYEGIHRYYRDDFLRNGGITTLKSYGCGLQDGDLQKIVDEVQDNVPKKHIDWLKNLPYYYENDNVFISHAAKNPTFPLDSLCVNDPKSIYYNLLWNRGEPGKIEGKLQIMGHNSHWGIKKFGNPDKPWAICIDGSRKNRLTGLHLTDLSLYHQDYLKD